MSGYPLLHPPILAGTWEASACRLACPSACGQMSPPKRLVKIHPVFPRMAALNTGFRVELLDSGVSAPFLKLSADLVQL